MIGVLVQMTATNSVEDNFNAVKHACESAKSQHQATMLFLPENFAFMSAHKGEAQHIAQPLDGPLIARYRALAKEHSLWLSLGGFQEASADDDEPRIYNTHLIVDSAGEIKAAYRKLHLYDAPFTGLVESTQAISGSDIVVADSPVGRLGVTICYDVRFPQLYQRLRFEHGAELLLVPAAFAVATGGAHWESLLRARAIETQCFVVAAAQAGQHNTDGNKRRSYGHSIVVDPWGTVIARMDDPVAPGMCAFTIDLGVMHETREKMPIVDHRRGDVYGT